MPSEWLYRFFDDFDLKEKKFGQETKVRLSWRQKGSDYPMQPYHLSDGSIRFICLATALLQPVLPSTIIIDEPELGLHPAAISILAELIQDAAKRTQVIIATQSPALIDQFALEDIVVVNREEGASTFTRLNERDFSTWLEEYTVGELWRKNVITGGRYMSKYINVIAIVEGKTEQIFVESVLKTYLAQRGIFITAHRLERRDKKGAMSGFHERSMISRTI
jgi:energy-coupling factor transporter ATP-binding protein EcfA2